MKRIVLALVILGIIPSFSAQRQLPTGDAGRSLPDFDIRELRSTDLTRSEQSQSETLIEKRRAGLVSFMASPEEIRLGTRIVSNAYGLPKLYLRDGRALTAPSALKPVETAKGFLSARQEIFSLNSSEVDRLRLIAEEATDNAKFLAFNQTVGGIDVFNAQIKITLNKNGEIIQVAMGDVVPGLNLATTPRLTPEEAVKAAFASIGKELPGSLSPAAATNGRVAFVNPGGNSFNPITAELSILPMTALSARLAYRIFLEVDSTSWYEILIDAIDGTALFRHNLYVFAGTARVWTESPAKGARTLITFPDGWIPASGIATTGNNVDAYLDADGNDNPDTITEPTLRNGRAVSETQTFDFTSNDGNTALDPRSFPGASVTSIFYFVNIAHDYYYGLGFNEAAGNFQTSNFDRGGTGNDAVVAEAQFGRFLNNAAFAPTPDGTAPKIRMGLFTLGTDSRIDDLDSDYDGQVIVHEYGHGVSNRLVGARTSTSCLTKIQSGALGEGWSDYFSISLFNNPVESTYLSQNATRGLRRYSYEGYPLTYEDIGNGLNGYEVHDDGEIWAGTLWDLRKSLGAATTDRLVMSGLKGTPCNPSMTDARDAIISADGATNAGANRTAIWTVFARHGLGYSAMGVDGTTTTGTRYDAAYDLPPDLQSTKNPAITSNPLGVRGSLGDLYAYTVVASNPGGGVLSYALTSGPANMTINASSGAVNWPGGFITSRVKITVTDGKGGKVVHGYVLSVLTALIDGKTVSIAGNTGTVGLATIVVPANLPVLQIRLRGGSGDTDLIVISPAGGIGISGKRGPSETLSFASPRAGEWQIQVYGYQSYTGVSLTANLINPAPIPATSTFSNLAGDKTSETFYRIAVPPGATNFSVATGGGSGDVDILLRRGSPAVCQPFTSVLMECLYDRVSAEAGTAETLTVANPGSGDWYLDVIGYDAFTGVKLDITISQPPLNLTSIGAATTSTLGTGAAIATGYATATVENGTAPYGTAVFSLTQNGYVVSEAGIPASVPVQSARIFIEYRTGVAAGIGKLDIFTGLAIANRGTASASLTYTLRDRAGQTLATGHGSLPAAAHRAKFVHQLQEIASDFNLPANFSTAVLYGSLEISSSQPVSVLGLRLTNNQRGETLLTSTAVANLSQAPANTPFYFPQLVDGGGYTTSVILTNTSATTQTGSISILEDSGGALSVQPVGGTPASSFAYSIPAAGTFVFQTDGSPATARAGWVKITPNAGSTAPVGAGVFSYSLGGILVTESGIPSALPTTRARLYVDKSRGHDTGLAIGNPGGAPINVTMQAFQNNGSNAGSGPATLNVLANGHKSAFVGQLINGLPDGFTGIADLTSSSPFVPLTLRSLTNGRGDFLLTTFPAPDISQTAPTPIVFPQIADGGGYATQFIFISANGSAAVNVNFIGDDGTPLGIARIP